MAHNIDNRRQRERRHHRAYMKAVRRLDAFDRQAKPGKDKAERYRLWLKCWRARHPADARSAEELSRVYEHETAPAKSPSPPQKKQKAPSAQ
jgi:hypothetical protein